MNIKTVLLAAVLFNSMALGSAAKPTNKNQSEKDFAFLIIFDKKGAAAVFLFNKTESTKRLMDPQSPHMKKIIENKTKQARKAAKDMGTYTIFNQFIIESNGDVILYPKAVLTIEP